MSGTSEKSRGIALILAIVLGVFGAHRFYVGKIGTGVLMICTFGGLGIWYLVDVVMIASGGFKDAKGRRVLRWDPDDQPDFGDLPQEVIEELVALRSDVSELAERLDFAERLLSDPARRGN